MGKKWHAGETFRGHGRPSGKIPDGCRWEPVEKNPDSGLVTEWKLVDRGQELRDGPPTRVFNQETYFPTTRVAEISRALDKRDDEKEETLSSSLRENKG